MFEYDTMIKENGKKYDWILVLVILLAAFILWGMLRLIERQGDLLMVSCDGEILGQISLNGPGDRYYLIRYGNVELVELTDQQAEVYMRRQRSVRKQGSVQGKESKPAAPSADIEYNLFVCKEDGTVYMLAASCPDQICVNHKAIEASYENIICLPHSLVMEIISGRDGKMESLDGIAY